MTLVRFAECRRSYTQRDAFTTEHRERQEKNLHRRAKEMGYELRKNLDILLGPTAGNPIRTVRRETARRRKNRDATSTPLAT